LCFFKDSQNNRNFTSDYSRYLFEWGSWNTPGRFVNTSERY
jgi:hypothetical protein